MAEKSFKEYFDYYTQLIESGKPFTFTRWGDGEILIMDGQKVGTDSLVHQNGEWNSLSGGETKLGKALWDAFNDQAPEKHLGLCCRCCNPDYFYHYLLPKATKSPVAPVSLFIQANYRHFLPWLSSLDSKGIQVSLVANHMAGSRLNNYPFKINNFHPTPDNCIEVFEQKGDELIEGVRNFAKTFNGQLVFVSSGPLSEIYINEMWKANPTNQYIDVGSALDQFTKDGKVTRPYQDPRHPHFNVQCRMH